MKALVRPAFALPAALALALTLGACGKDNVKEKTLRLTERDTDDFAFVDNPPKTRLGHEGPERLSNGDQLSFRSDILDSGKKVGALDATCFTTKGGGSFEKSHAQCEGTISLADGSLALTVGGTPFAQDDTRGAVTGGTGAYEGATGSFVSKERDGRSTDEIHIFLPED